MKRLITIATIVTLVWSQVEDPNIQNAIDSIFSNSSGFLNDYEEVTPPPLGSLGALEKCGEGSQRNVFVCVPYYNCDKTTNTVSYDPQTDGSNTINIRAPENNTCDHYLDVCCRTTDSNGNTVTPSTIDNGNGDGQGRIISGTSGSGQTSSTSPATPTTERNPANTNANTNANQSFCGIRNANGLDFTITGNSNEAEFGEFPWMVALLRKNPAQGDRLAICGGALITPNVVLTGAHCVDRFSSSDVIVRAGEWDTQTTKERIPYQERNVARIIAHEFFNSKTLYNDVALLVLDRPLTRADNVGTICLPGQNQIFNARDCFATGWGKNTFGSQGAYSAILKKIQLPLVQQPNCQTALRTTRLGESFILHRSFICAGGEADMDTCTGDGGSPLVCPDPNNPNRYVQVGIVAWGIGCGETQIPGVYADVPQFRNWIENNLQQLQINTSPFIL